MPHSTQSQHSIISPAILYWGTPVVLVTSSNEDGTSNISAISSAFWLGHHCVLGFAAQSKTTQNIRRTKQCVLNLPSDDMAAHINALSTTTGVEKPSESKLARGYRYVKDKWSCAGLTPQASHFVRPARIRECPVQMECELVGTHELMENVPDRRGFIVALEVRVLRTHVIDDIRLEGHANRIDPDRWRPMIMSFQELYGLKGEKVSKSELARIDEERYRALTKSNVIEFPGDDDEEIAKKTAEGGSEEAC